MTKQEKFILFALIAIFLAEIILFLGSADTLEKNAVKKAYQFGTLLYSTQTRYQRIDVVDDTEQGLSLYLSKHLQISQKGSSAYHEGLIHPVMLAHPNPKRVLVIGGGDGGAIREVLKHNCVEKVEMVEIDEKVIEVSKKYMPFISDGAFDSPKAKIIIDDGRRYLKYYQGLPYDIIFIDLPDPRESRLANLYTKEFYELCRKNLTPDGIVASQNCSPYFYPRVYQSTYKTISAVFPITLQYRSWVAGFEMWGYSCGSLKYSPLALTEELIKKKMAERKVTTSSYSPASHFAYFIFPKDQLELYSRLKVEISTDQRPVVFTYYAMGIQSTGKNDYLYYLKIIGGIFLLLLSYIIWISIKPRS